VAHKFTSGATGKKLTPTLSVTEEYMKMNIGTMKVLALLCITATILTGSFDKTANVSEYDFSDFLYLLSTTFECQFIW